MLKVLLFKEATHTKKEKKEREREYPFLFYNQKVVSRVQEKKNSPLRSSVAVFAAAAAAGGGLRVMTDPRSVSVFIGGIPPHFLTASASRSKHTSSLPSHLPLL